MALQRRHPGPRRPPCPGRRAAAGRVAARAHLRAARHDPHRFLAARRPGRRAADLLHDRPGHRRPRRAGRIHGRDVDRAAGFPVRLRGLVSTADDYLAFARFLLDGGVVGGTRLLSKQSVAAMTTNHLAPEQIEGTGFLDGQGWGYGMSVTVKADEVSGPGRYGWSGGYGTDWFNDPGAGLTVILLSQVTDLLWNGALQEFSRLAYAPD
ncbi:serine hydrolase [Paractinoplanes durhamensis]|uniref:serine hydrolase n=1 Tax=Paractinoplanes durhamensis TaxID=113563 RepID=UPI00363CA197